MKILIGLALIIAGFYFWSTGSSEADKASVKSDHTTSTRPYDIGSIRELAYINAVAMCEQNAFRAAIGETLDSCMDRVNERRERCIESSFGDISDKPTKENNSQHQDMLIEYSTCTFDIEM
jgi:hypothetical protein